MKLYRHNLTSDGDIFLKNALITHPNVRFLGAFPSTWGFELFEVLKIQARICVRTQTWLFTSKAENEVPSSDSRHIGCSHLRWANRKSLKTSLRFKMSHLSTEEDLHLDCSDLICCPVCFTEIHADRQVVKKAPNAQIVMTTQWQYLIEDVPSEFARRRRCYHLEEKQEKFNFDHVTKNILLRSPSDIAPTGSIRDAFEQKTTTPFDSILSVEQAWTAFSRWARRYENSRRALATMIYDESTKTLPAKNFG